MRRQTLFQRELCQVGWVGSIRFVCLRIRGWRGFVAFLARAALKQTKSTKNGTHPWITQPAVTGPTGTGILLTTLFMKSFMRPQFT